MRLRLRALVIAMATLFTMLWTVSPALASGTYHASLSFNHYQKGACRSYTGTSIHIQLTTSSSNGSGTYTIEVGKCFFGANPEIVGAPGTCNYPGFCGLGWNINLGTNNTYQFIFTKANDGRTVSCADVQMWST
jgi:hypothetical protein